MFSNGIDLVNQNLYADDALFTKRSSAQCVICQGNLLLVDFAITMLIDQFVHWLQVGSHWAIHDSTILSMLPEAMLSATKVPLKI